MKSVYPMSSSSAVFPDRGSQTKAKLIKSSPQLTLVSPAPTARNNAWQVAPNLLISFRYAWAGVRYAFLTQRNFRIHTLAGSVVLTTGIILQLEPIALSIFCLLYTSPSPRD